MPRYFDVGGVGVVSFPNEADDDFVRKTLTTEYPDATKVNEVSFGDEPQVKPENNGIVLGSLLRGVDNLQASLYAGGAVAAQAFGAEDAKNWFLSGYVRNLQEAEANPARIPSYKNIIDEHGDLLNTISNAGTYALEGIFENVPTMVPALIGGGGAAMLATAGRKALVEKVGVEAAKQMLVKRATAAGIAGAYAGNVAQEVGSIAGDIYQKTGNVEVGVPLAYGAVAAAVDTASDLIGASKFMQGAEKAALAKVLGRGLSEEVTGRLIRRVGYEGLKQMGVEGVTEGVQTAIEKLALSHADPNTPFWTSENLDEIVDSVLKGGLSGGAFGAGGELYKSARGRVSEAGTTVADVPPIIEADLTAADLERKAVALDQAGASETAKAVRETLDATPTITPPTVEDLTAQFADLHDGGIAIVQEPEGNWDARSFFDPDTKELLGVALNQSKIQTPEQAQIAVDHEISHAASESGILDETLKQLTGEEWDGIEQQLNELGYSPEDDRETVARSVDVLRESWSNRNWFQQAVGHIMRYANKAGFRLTRLAAESIAAKAAADAYVRLKQISPAPTGEAAPSSLPAEPPMVVGGMVPTTTTQNAPQEVSIQKGVLGERANGNETRQAAEAGGGDSLLGAAQSQEKVTPYEAQQAQQTGGEKGIPQEGTQGDQGLREEGGLPGLSEEEIVRDSRVRFKRSEEALTVLAKDSEAFKNWYSEFKGFLEGFLESHPEYAPLLSEMLNATSAATSVKSNVPRAVQAFREFIQTGRFDSFKLLSHKYNLERAGRGEQLEGPKISQYSAAIFGDENAIPVDRHILQIMFGITETSSGKVIADAKRRIAQIGMRLGWTPRQVQAALWAANQKRKGQVAVSYEAYLNNHRQAIFDAIAADTSGRGREASRRIAERIGAGTGAQGSVAGQPAVRESRVVTPQQDADYMAAVEKGDTETAQRMVDEAAKAAGYNVGPVYHGTKAEFTKFDAGRLGDTTAARSSSLGFFASSSKYVAERFSGDNKTPLRLAAKLHNPVVFSSTYPPGRPRDTYGRPYISQDAFDVFWGTLVEMLHKPKGDITSGDVKNLAVAWGKLGYDGVLFKDTYMDSSANPESMFVVFSPEQFKSADPITRDDAGNVIPLSQRFQPTSPDIRYSKTPEPTYTGTGETKTTEALKAIRKVVDDLPPVFDYHTQSEAQRTDAAKSFVKAFAGDMSRALLVANDPETYAKSTMSMQPIILGEIAKEAKAAGDTVAYDGVWDSLQRIGSSTGQNLQAFAQLRAMFDPSYLTARAGQSWKQGLGKQIGPVDGVKNVVNQGTKRARVTAKKAANKILEGLTKGTNWAKIFDQHMEAQNATRQDLFNKLQADPEFQKLSQADQLRLVNDLGKLWEEHRFKEIDGLLKKYAQVGGRDINKKMAQAARTVLPDLLRAANRGALFDETVWNAMAPKYGLPAWTPERAATLQDMLEKEQKLPVNSIQRSRLAQKRATWMMQQKGVTNMEILGEWWYASVLSGIRTQVDNGASFVNVAIEAALAVASNPAKANYLVPAFFRGLAIGKRRFNDIAFKGDFSHSVTQDVDANIGKLAALQDDPSAVKRFLSNGRYVMQFMAATDTLNAAAAQELRATLLAYSRAKDIAAPSSAEFKKAFQDILQVSDGAIAAATDQAQQEINRGELAQADLERRRDDILEQQRPSDLTDAAREYGKIATGNREPVGLVGALYRGLKTTRMAAPIIHPALPFLRMAANLTNMYTDYLPPVALARLWFNHPESHVGYKVGQAFDKQFEKMTAEDYQLLKAKFVLGSVVLMQGLAYAMAAGDDDKDRWFDIEGSWSGLNTDQKILLQNAKRQPYSFKVGDQWFSYKMLPYAAALATIGNVRDMQRYTKASKKEQMDYFTTAMFRGAMMVKDLSLLNGISDLMATANDSQNPDRFYSTMKKFAARTVGGLYPGILKEAGAWIDPTMQKPLSFGELMLKEWPGSSVTIGRPALNVLGEPVSFPKYPWSRVVSERPSSREMQALVDKADMGVFPVIPGPRDMLALPGGKRRPMTPEEGYLYGKMVGEGYKKLLTDNLRNFEAMNAKQAETYLTGPAFDEVRARAKREIVRRSGGR